MDLHIKENNSDTYGLGCLCLYREPLWVIYPLRDMLDGRENKTLEFITGVKEISSVSPEC